MKTTNTESTYESGQLISLSMDSHLKVEAGLVFDTTKTAVLKSLYDRACYIVPEGVKVIKSRSFALTNRLTIVDLTDSLEELGDEVFSKACKMEDLIMPDSVKKVGCHLCSGCENLKHVYVSKSLDRLGFQMFHGCLNLKDIVLGSFTTNHLIEAEPRDLEGVDAEIFFLRKPNRDWTTKFFSTNAQS